MRVVANRGESRCYNKKCVFNAIRIQQPGRETCQAVSFCHQVIAKSRAQQLSCVEESPPLWRGDSNWNQFGNIVMQSSESAVERYEPTAVFARKRRKIGIGNLTMSEHAFPLNVCIGEIIRPETVT